MARRLDDEAPWSRTLLMGIGALVAVSLLVGLVVGVIAFGAAKMSGIGRGEPERGPHPHRGADSDQEAPPDHPPGLPRQGRAG